MVLVLCTYVKKGLLFRKFQGMDAALGLAKELTVCTKPGAQAFWRWWDDSGFGSEEAMSSVHGFGRIRGCEREEGGGRRVPPTSY